MNCPDINDLLDFLDSDEADPALEAHLLTCSGCQDELHFIRTMRETMDLREEVPEHLIQRVLDQLPAEGLPSEKEPVPSLQVLGSGVLGWITGIAAVVAAGSGTGDPITLLTFSLLVGVAAGLIQLRLGGDWKDLRQG